MEDRTVVKKTARRVLDFQASVVATAFGGYLLKCVIGTAICYALYIAFPQYPLYWSIVSLLLVLAPDDEESLKLAIDRMKANISGASIGLIALLLGRPGLISLCVAVVLTILFCEFVRLGKASRSALAALIIVMLTGNATWFTALERMACVVIGCAVAMTLTVISTAITRKTAPVDRHR